MVLRDYQRAALDALEAYWNGNGGHPLVVMPTGTGKSLGIGQLMKDIAGKFPGVRVLLLTHSRELIKQDLRHLLEVWPDAPCGINSAALNQRDWDAQIVLATIGSVYHNPKRLGVRHLIIVDEAHLVPHRKSGMYRTLFAALRELEPALRVCGFTATPYRLDSGRLDQGDDKLFDDIVYEYPLAEAVRDGWLAPLSSKGTNASIDVSGVTVRGGEFVESELEDAANDAALIQAAVDEIIKLGEKRRRWVLFCCGVRHAQNVCDALRARGIVAATINGDTPKDERERVIADFRSGKIRAVTNVRVLTTGFDVPEIDLLAMLRPTLSTGLYVQMAGRGMRKTDGKRDCVVLDFAGNVMRHGPVDQAGNNPHHDDRRGKAAVNTVAARKCPDCGELNALNATICVSCGYGFPRANPKPKHNPYANDIPIMGAAVSGWMKVTHVSYAMHLKRSDPSKPPTFRVEYLCGLSPYSEYICLQHAGYARQKAEKWWFAMGGHMPPPGTIDEALQRLHKLHDPSEIVVARDGKFWNVIKRRAFRDDGTEIEIDRNNNVFIPNRSPPPPPPEMNDGIPY
jgi:DNA repair protein RadD